MHVPCVTQARSTGAAEDGEDAPDAATGAAGGNGAGATREPGSAGASANGGSARIDCPATADGGLRCGRRSQRPASGRGGGGGGARASAGGCTGGCLAGAAVRAKQQKELDAFRQSFNKNRFPTSPRM